MRKLFILFLLLFAFASPVLTEAHVSYVLEKNTLQQAQGRDDLYLLSALTGFNISLMIATAVAVILLYLFLHHTILFQKHVRLFQKRSKTYHVYLAWIMRLGLGIALIGAGTHHVLISPTLTHLPLFGTLQIALGFLLLVGLLTSVAAVTAVALYIYAFIQSPSLFGNLDFLGLALSLLALGSSRPGLDDLFHLRFHFHLRSLQSSIPVVARVTLGLAMMYLAVYEKILNPHLSQLVVEQYALTAVIPVPTSMWVLSAGIIEFLVGLFLSIGFFTRTTAAVAFLILSASFFYFHEVVYSHVTMFALLSLVFILGAGRNSVDTLLQQRRRTISNKRNLKFT